MKRTILVMALLASNAVMAYPKHTPVPGGVAVIDLPATDENKPPVAKYWKTPVPVYYDHSTKAWKAVVGLTLSGKAGEDELSYSIDGAESKINFTVDGKAYETQVINSDAIKGKVSDISEGDLERIKAEKAKTASIKSNYTEGHVFLDFIRPVAGTNTGSFGKRRIFNGLKKQPHTGMDIAAAEGTPIVAAETGTVVDVGDYFFAGNSVWIDHGQGVYTLYAHLQTASVKTGDFIKRGDALGTVGKTGRATGPHLHWSVYINGFAVDPSAFIE